jgi:hypothetical protein
MSRPHPISQGERAWLSGALESWRAEGLITADQAQAILDRYDSPEAIADRRRSRAMVSIMALAALMVAAGIFLLIGYNWQVLPRWSKLAIMVAIVAGVNAGGLHLRYRRGLAWASEVAFLLGGLLYGAGIWLIAQAYHLDAHYPDGFWWWAIGVLPLALVLDSALLHGLAAVLLAVWVGTEILGIPGLGGGWLLVRWDALPRAAFGLPLLALPGLIQGYRRGSADRIGPYVFLLAWWMALQPLAYLGEPDWAYVFYLGGLGALLVILAEAHPPGSRLAIPYRVPGALLAGAMLIPPSYFDFQRDLLGDSSTGGVTASRIIMPLVPPVLTLLGVALAWRQSWPWLLPAASDDPAGRRHTLLASFAVPSALLLLFALLPLWMVLVREPLVPTLLANVAMVAGAIWLLLVGLGQDRGAPYAGGACYLLLWVLLRYIDLFGDFGGMLGASLLFFASGGALFGLGLLWRRRKAVKEALDG